MINWTEVYSDKPETFPAPGQSVALKTVVRKGDEGLLRLISKVTIAKFSSIPDLYCSFDLGVAVMHVGKSEHKKLGHLEWTPCEPEDFWALVKAHTEELMVD